MGRCEGYYLIENRRCDRGAVAPVHGADGGTYAVCAYHDRDPARTQVARWNGESGMRRSAPTRLVLAPPQAALPAAPA